MLSPVELKLKLLGFLSFLWAQHASIEKDGTTPTKSDLERVPPVEILLSVQNYGLQVVLDTAERATTISCP